MPMRESKYAQLVARLSASYANKRQRFLDDGVIDAREAEELEHDRESLAIAQELEDNLIAGFQVIRHGATLEYTERRMRARKRDLEGTRELAYAGHAD